MAGPKKKRPDGPGPFNRFAGNAAMLEQGTMTEATALPRENPLHLRQFRAALTEMYGDLLARVVLYSSRGGVDPQKIPTLPYFSGTFTTACRSPDRIALAGTDILSATATATHALPFPAGLLQERTLLMHEIRREGLDL